MEEENLRKGPWYEEEDERLKAFVLVLGARRWDSIAKKSGLRRSGKSCRLRWLNYLRPCLKQGAMTLEEEHIILKLQQRWGNKWAKIARRLPGRTDNEIKNYWRTHLRKKECIQNLSLNQSSSSSSKSYNFSSSETCSSSVHTNKEDVTITTPEISSNIISNDNNNNNNDGILTEKIYNFGAITLNNDYDNNDDNYQKRLSDYAITNSPYENRLLDWMNLLSKEKSDEEYKYNEKSVVDEQFCLDDSMMINWCYGDDIISAWDFSDITWDV